MELLTGIFTAFGLSASAGLNAYIPLLVVGLLAHYTNLLQLSSPWDTLSNPWIILLLCVLVIIEMLADKIPAVNHINDLIQTVIRPTAGAIAFAASAHGARCQGGGSTSGSDSNYWRCGKRPCIRCRRYCFNGTIHRGDCPAYSDRDIASSTRIVHHLLALRACQQRNYLI